jgi:hypothetical protein
VAHPEGGGGGEGGIPSGRSLVLGIDKQGYPAHLRRNAKAAATRREKELSAEPLTLQAPRDSEPAKAKDGNVVTSETAPNEIRSSEISERTGAQAIKAEDGPGVRCQYSHERLCSAALVVLARVSPQIVI